MNIVDTPIHPRAAWYGELTRYAWQSIGFETRPRPIVRWQYVQWQYEPLLDISPIDTLKYETFDDSPKLCMCDRCQRARFIQDGGKWHGRGNAAPPAGRVVGPVRAQLRLPQQVGCCPRRGPRERGPRDGVGAWRRRGRR